MKKLTNLVLGLGFSLISTSIFSQNILSERLRDYQNKAEPQALLPIWTENGGFICPFSYDVDSDGRADVFELYYASLNSLDLIQYSRKPYAYLFDLNNDKHFDEREWFYDKEMKYPYLKPEEIRVSGRREVEL